MKKLTLLPVLLLATIQLNGALSRLGQAGRQLAPTLRSQLGTQPMRLPATMPKTCPAGMRLLSSSSRSQGGYDYVGGQQQAAFGGREALLLGGAALAGKTVYDYLDTSDGHKLKQAQNSVLTNVYAADNIEDLPHIKEFLKSLQKTDIKFKKTYDGYGWQIIETLEWHPEALPIVIDAVVKNITKLTVGHQNYDWSGPLSSPVLQILNRFPESRTPIIQAITDNKNFMKMAKDGYGYGRMYIQYILENFPESRNPIAVAASKHIAFLVEENKDLVDTILTEYPEESEKLILPAIIGDIQTVVRYSPFSIKLLQQHPDLRNPIIRGALDNIVIVKKSSFSIRKSVMRRAAYEILEEALTTHPESAKRPIADFIITTINETPSKFDYTDAKMAKILLSTYPELQKPILDATNAQATNLAETKNGKEFLEFIRNNFKETV